MQHAKNTKKIYAIQACSFRHTHDYVTKIYETAKLHDYLFLTPKISAFYKTRFVIFFKKVSHLFVQVGM